jgi:hypothetical protein
MCECVHDSPSWTQTSSPHTHHSDSHGRSTHGGNRTLTLRATIERLEKERASEQAQMKPREMRQPDTGGGGATKGTPLFQKQHPKCANPACPTAFHWTGGGKFLRFRPDPIVQNESSSESGSTVGIHGVKHYWLCERCSQMFTLVFDTQCGVVLKVLWPEVPMVAEPAKKLSAA